MAAPKYTDRLRAQEVRSLALDEIKAILIGEKDYGKDFKKQLLLKLAPTLLPRLNEHTGEDGGEIVMKIINYGDNNSLPVPAEKLSTADTESD